VKVVDVLDKSLEEWLDEGIKSIDSEERTESNITGIILSLPPALLYNLHGGF
jgi:hypothetical protein